MYYASNELALKRDIRNLARPVCTESERKKAAATLSFRLTYEIVCDAISWPSA